MSIFLLEFIICESALLLSFLGVNSFLLVKLSDYLDIFCLFLKDRDLSVCFWDSGTKSFYLLVDFPDFSSDNELFSFNFTSIFNLLCSSLLLCEVNFSNFSF